MIAERIIGFVLYWLMRPFIRRVPRKAEARPFTIDDAAHVLQARVHAANRQRPRSERITENPKKLRRKLNEKMRPR